MSLPNLQTARIAISGCSGTGKTTLALALATKLSVPYLEEDFRALTEAALHYNQVRTGEGATAHQRRRHAFDSYMAACRDWLRKRKQDYAANSSYVADRSGFDILMQLVMSRDSLLIDPLWLEFLALCQQESRHHDIIIIPTLMPWSLKDEHNEAGLVRRTSLQARIHSQSTLIGLVQQFSRGHYLLLRPHPGRTDSVEERIEMILPVLKQRSARTQR